MKRDQSELVPPFLQHEEYRSIVVLDQALLDIYRNIQEEVGQIGATYLIGDLIAFHKDFVRVESEFPIVKISIKPGQQEKLKERIRPEDLAEYAILTDFN